MQDERNAIESHPAYPVALREIGKVLPYGTEFTTHMSAEAVRTQMIIAFLIGVQWAADCQQQVEQGLVS